MTTTRLQKAFVELAEEVAAPIAAAGLLSMGLSVYEAKNLNGLSVTSGVIANEMTAPNADNAAIALQEKNQQHKMFLHSEILGLTQAALINLMVLPSVLNSISHKTVKGQLSVFQYFAQNWDQVIGRGLQLGYAGMLADSCVNFGKGNTDTATWVSLAAPVAGFFGTVLINHNRLKKAEQQNVQLPGGYDPLNNAASAPSLEGSVDQTQAFRPQL